MFEPNNGLFWNGHTKHWPGLDVYAKTIVDKS